MKIEPRPFADRPLLRRLILEAFAWSAEEPVPGQVASACLDLPSLMDAILARGTQLEGVSATQVGKVRPGQVREELFAMPNVQALDANTPRERFCLLAGARRE